MMLIFTLLCLVTNIFAYPNVLGTIDKSLDWRIVGGSDAEEGQFKYQVSLRYIYDNKHICGGILLSSSWILTAAHCVSGDTSPSDLSAVVGTTTLNSGGYPYNISAILVHEEWDFAKALNDIALLKTEGQVAIGDLVDSVSIGKTHVGAGVTAVLSGWGRISFPGEIPNNLQFLNVLTLTNSECQNRWGSETIYESNVCTLTKVGEGACHGDSGGPLVAKYSSRKEELIGIVSWGLPCARGHPDVFTRVSSYVDWIEKNAN